MRPAGLCVTPLETCATALKEINLPSQTVFATALLLVITTQGTQCSDDADETAVQGVVLRCVVSHSNSGRQHWHSFAMRRTHVYYTLQAVRPRSAHAGSCVPIHACVLSQNEDGLPGCAGSPVARGAARVGVVLLAAGPRYDPLRRPARPRPAPWPVSDAPGLARVCRGAGSLPRRAAGLPATRATSVRSPPGSRGAALNRRTAAGHSAPHLP